MKRVLLFLILFPIVIFSQENYQWELRIIEEPFGLMLGEIEFNGNVITSFDFFSYTALSSFGWSDSDMNNWTYYGNTSTSDELYQFDYCLKPNNDVFICADSGIVFKSTNLGETWEKRKLFENSEAITTIEFIDNDLGFLCNNGDELFKTTDGGDTWFKNEYQVDDFEGSFLITDISLIKNLLVLKIFDFTSKAYHYKISYDKGETWEQAYKSFEGKEFLDIYIKDDLSIWGVNSVPTGDGDIMYDVIAYSDDLGKTWSEKVYKVDGHIGGIGKIAFHEEKSFGIATGADVYLSIDDGDNWILLEDSISAQPGVYQKGDIEQVNNELFFFSHNRILKFIYLDTSVDDLSEVKEFKFITDYNNDRIAIDFHQDFSDKLISIYDITGKLLFNQNISNNYWEYDLNNLNYRGTYLIYIQMENKSYFLKFVK
jgi:photosystem II stability/assembly factor-like uncharacterized protein